MSKPASSAPPIDIPEQLSLGPGVKEDNFLDPVLPFYNGEGFPYAPTDWPNPGDTWGWRVGRRISNSGYYTDRLLIPPRNLQKTTCPKYFSSRCSLEHYILKEFPNADIDAFFASFSWRVPSTLGRSKTVKATSLSQKKIEEVEKEEIPLAAKWKRKHTAASSSAKRQTRQSVRQSVPVAKATDSKIDLCSLNEEAETPSKGMRSASHCEDDQPNSDSIAGNQFPAKCMPESFDNYIDSLDDILQKPLSEASLPYAGTINSSTQDDELAEAPSKLSSLLDMDFPSLVSSKNIYELIHLASNLRKDPNLSAEKLLKLKLIGEIPSYGKVFLENKRITEQANHFFAVLEDNKAKVISLKEDYNEMKEKLALLQTELESTLLAINEIDDQIAKLNSQRVELMKTVATKKMSMANLTNDQQKVAHAIQKIVHQVQVANSKKAEWGVKKKNAETCEAEILARFGPLK